MLTNGAFFLIIVFVAFFIFATQAGAKESRLPFLNNPFVALASLLIVGAVLWFIWGHGTGVLFTH